MNAHAEHTEVLSRISLFASLDPSELAALGEAMELHEVHAGEAIVTRGETESSLFVVLSGTLEADPGAGLGDKPQLNAGDFFGEMALLTGEPRSATVTAVTNAELLELDQESLFPILENRPTLAESLASAASARKAHDREAELEAAREIQKCIYAHYGLGMG